MAKKTIKTRYNDFKISIVTDNVMSYLFPFSFLQQSVRLQGLT